jgi:hypothetical protein
MATSFNIKMPHTGQDFSIGTKPVPLGWDLGMRLTTSPLETGCFKELNDRCKMREGWTSVKRYARVIRGL